MKKFAIILAAAWLVAACSPKEVVNTLPSNSKVFTASIEQSSRTYTDGTKVYWINGDAVNIFDHGTTGYKYTFAGETGATSGSFTTTSEVTAQDALPYTYAFYPYASYIEVYDAGTIYGYLSPGQDYEEGSFDVEVGNPMVAVSEDDNLVFKNVAGYLMLRLIGDNSTSVSSVTVSSNNGEYIAGDMLITVAPGQDPVSVPYDAEGYAEVAASVYLPTSNPVFLDSSKPLDIWISLIPGTVSSGITVTVVGEDHREFKYTSSNPLTIKRGVCTPTAPLSVKFPERLPLPVANIYGTYENNGASIYGSVYDEGSWSFTLEATDDATKGNVLISSYYGFDCSIYADWNEDTWTLSFANDDQITAFVSGDKVYYFWVDAYDMNSNIELYLDDQGNFTSGNNYPGYYYEFYDWPGSVDAIDTSTGDYDYNHFLSNFTKVVPQAVAKHQPQSSLKMEKRLLNASKLPALR